MPTPKKPKSVPGLSFRISVQPLRNGHPWPNVEPIDFLWDQGILQWHEGHAETGIMVALRTAEQRVRKSLKLRSQRRAGSS